VITHTVVNNEGTKKAQLTFKHRYLLYKHLLELDGMQQNDSLRLFPGRRRQKHSQPAGSSLLLKVRVKESIQFDVYE